MESALDRAVTQAQKLQCNVVDSLPAGELENRLRAAIEQERPLRVKLGIDPTAPDIHLGHAVVLRKLRQFQDLGHRVVLIIGDTTAQVGDPSGRSELRPTLSAQEIEANAATFHRQAQRILDPSPQALEVRRNSEWLQMALPELLTLMRTTTVAQLLEREDFAKRLSENRPISVLETIYPLLQGYDSVAVHADVELGGTDQKFNLLLGRDIQRAYKQQEQAIVTMPILVGTDGRRKMSKSLGNQIGITDEPEQMYGKTMAIPDEAMQEYYELLLSREVPIGLPPRDAKRLLAFEIVSWLHGAEHASAAQAAFDRLFVEGREPEQMEEVQLEQGVEQVHLPALIADAFGLSRSQARRLLAEGAVQLGPRRLAADEQDLPPSALDGQVLRVGKRRFCRLRAA
jgi:tyrosyl-tRNA synthetase